ncbi:hypothetical protein [Chamaesiphon sp.]|uniref:hypothetical protein n=1 Tax=Chamaesiphon sp. TaxID=2814140 RepID=UPI0035943788
MPKQPTSYSLTNHACSHCGGRILARSGGAGISGYINYLCSCCEASGSGMINPPICYCNMKWRGSDVSNYRCVHKEELITSPWLKDACAHSGYDFDSQQMVGMVCLEAEKTARKRWENVRKEAKTS